ncbi:MAG TPA: APC family permease [Propionibacteriaceae bacterium]
MSEDVRTTGTESTVSAPQPEDSAHTLRGKIGVAEVVFLVVAAAAPLTAIGGALPVMLAIGNGAGTPLAYLIVAVALLVFSVGYAAMSSHLIDAGAFYAYVSRGLGRRVGLGAAGLALLAYTAIQAGIYGLAATTLQALIAEAGGPSIPWWLCAGILMAIVGLLGFRSIDVGAKVLGVLLVLEVGIVAIVAIAVLVRGGAEGINLTSFTPAAFSSGAPGIALMFAIASFIGFEATAIYGEESKNPTRTVPVATYIAVIVIGVFYAFSSWAIVLAFGTDKVVEAAQADTAGLTFAAAATYLGPWAAIVMEILLMTSLFAALLAFHNAIARYLFALGRRAELPRALARTHPSHGSPHIGSLVQTISAVVVVALFAIVGADPVLQLFTWMSGLATIATLLLMTLTSIAIIAFFTRHRVDTRVWNTKVAPVLGSLALIAITVVALANFTTLISGSAALATVLLVIIVAVFAAGLGLSFRKPSGAQAP